MQNSPAQVVEGPLLSWQLPLWSRKAPNEPDTFSHPVIKNNNKNKNKFDQNKIIIKNEIFFIIF